MDNEQAALVVKALERIAHSLEDLNKKVDTTELLKFQGSLTDLVKAFSLSNHSRPARRWMFSRSMF